MASGIVTFDPAFDFVEGTSYLVIVRQYDARTTVSEFIIALSDGIAIPHIMSVYPSGVKISQSTLR